MFLRSGDAGGEAAAAQFDLSSGPKATWLAPARIVEHAGPSAPLPPVTAGGTTGTTSIPSTTSVVRVSSTLPISTTTTNGKATAGVALGAVTSSTVAPRASTSSTTSTTVRPTTTTTVPVPVTVSLPPLPVPVGPVTPAQKWGTHSARGVASWFHAPDRTCAHVSIPVGTIIRITRLSTGVVTTCLVDDWGPADTSRIIDLSLDTFERLAPADAGLIDVLIEW